MKTALGVTFALLLTAVPAAAQTCSALPNNLSNGTVADATQVMANFNALLGCINNNGAVTSGTAGQVGYYGTTGSVISGESLSALLDSAFGSTQGAILYRGASGWTLLPPGTIGYVLQTGGPSANPSWSPAGSGGGISTLIAAGVAASGPTVALSTVAIVSRPALSAFTWLNQASATATDNANGPLVLATTQNTTGNGLNALVKSVAGASWTVTMQYALGNHTGGTAVDLAGLIVYNSSSGKIYVCGPNGSAGMGVWAYNSTGSWNSNAASVSALLTPGAIWTRAQYVSGTTTVTFSYSTDGFTWQTVYSTTTPFVGAPTSYGVTVGSQGNSAGYILSLNYMAESSP